MLRSHHTCKDLCCDGLNHRNMEVETILEITTPLKTHILTRVYKLIITKTRLYIVLIPLNLLLYCKTGFTGIHIIFHFAKT